MATAGSQSLKNFIITRKWKVTAISGVVLTFISCGFLAWQVIMEHKDSINCFCRDGVPTTVETGCLYDGQHSCSTDCYLGHVNINGTCRPIRDGSTVKMQDGILLHKTGKAHFLAKNVHFTPEFVKIFRIF